ncbi:MAG: aconitase family protein [Polyangiaceae bacterium]
MAQKIFAPRRVGRPGAAGRPVDRGGPGEIVDLLVDQVVVAREHARVQAAAAAALKGSKKVVAELAVAYDNRCIGAGEPASPAPAELLAHGVVLARAGAGFPGPVHLERFASPARLCVTDEPRLAGVGGIGMLSLVVPSATLAGALAGGRATVREPVSVQVQLGGRLRPFVCAIDATFELIRRGLGDVVRRVEASRGAPVVLEFAGPSARTLSVAERGVLAGVAPMVGAAGALFVSDERTEVFLRDQRRSKAHRALAPDPGAPFEDAVAMDLGAVDPLLLDGRGIVRAVRDLRGQPVAQVLLGGDRGTTLRDLFAAAALLKSKRVPQDLDFLLAVPSRQMLEVLSRAGALADFIAAGARIVEPDEGVTSGALYRAVRGGVSMRSSDVDPSLGSAGIGGSGAASSSGSAAGPFVVSAESLAYAVATGEVGDPRSFKRPVRVTVPRELPTDDVLVARSARPSRTIAPATAGARPATSSAAAVAAAAT